MPLLDDVTTSPASRRLASARPALAPKCTPYFLTGPKLAAAFVRVELLRLRKGASKLWTSAAAPGSGVPSASTWRRLSGIRLGRRPGHFLVFGPQGGHGWYLDDTECLDFPPILRMSVAISGRWPTRRSTTEAADVAQTMVGFCSRLPLRQARGTSVPPVGSEDLTWVMAAPAMPKTSKHRRCLPALDKNLPASR